MRFTRLRNAPNQTNATEKSLRITIYFTPHNDTGYVVPPLTTLNYFVPHFNKSGYPAGQTRK